MTDYAGKIRSIEVSFAAEVEIDQEDQTALYETISNICRKYEAAHPGRVMWLFGYGQKMLVEPMMLNDGDEIPCDESCISIKCAEREK